MFSLSPPLLEREREREEETSVSPYIKTSTHHTTLYEGLRCWVSHPMFALIPPLFPPLMRERERERERGKHQIHPILRPLPIVRRCLRCWVSHPMFSLSPPLLSLLVGTSCDLVFRGLWGMCRYGAVSFLERERERERETSDYVSLTPR